MSEANVTATVNAPVGEVWAFIRDIGNWAPFVPGYQNHKVVSEAESTWALKRNIGALNLELELRAWVTEWKEQEMVAFRLEGKSRPVKGEGYVLLMADEFALERTDIILNLKLEGKGFAKALVDYIIRPRVKPDAERLLEKIKAEIEKRGEK